MFICIDETYLVPVDSIQCIEITHDCDYSLTITVCADNGNEIIRWMFGSITARERMFRKLKAILCVDMSA